MDKIAQILKSQIDQKVTLLQNSISDGRAKDYAEYQKLCGEIRGLLTARNYITTLIQEMDEIDE